MSANWVLLIYLLIFVPLLMMRPLWPFRFKRTIPASPQAIWRLIGDHENALAMFPHIDDFRARRDPDDPAIFHCTARLKGRKKEFRYVVRILEMKPCELIRHEFLDPAGNRTWGRNEYRLAAVGQGTLIELRVRIRVAGIYGIVCNWRAYRRHLKELEALAEWA